MEIEAGSEWFNQETLTLVEVDSVNDDYVTFLTADMTGREWEPDFLRDYAPNEPVTLELLERMGWVTALFDEGPVRHRFLRLSDHPIDLRWSDDGSFHVMFESYVEQPLAPVTTLRDLLNVLRVFGVEQPVKVA